MKGKSTLIEFIFDTMKTQKQREEICLRRNQSI